MVQLPELDDLLKLENLNLPQVRFETLEMIHYKGEDYPIKSVVIGPEDKSLPTFGLFGGVHGLERIGSQVIIAFLHSFFHQLSWDKELNKNIENYRIVALPVINPVGLARFSRCNPNGVDLMRNAPVEAQGEALPLISGHRFGPSLPWYRGNPSAMEKESYALINFVEREMFPSKVSVALDVHSGFGVKDQIWYPYAKTREDFPRKEEALLLKSLLDRTYPNHIYKFEGQSDNYITHGDLWDHLFDIHYADASRREQFFMPLTLELGSWNWLRKNPLQFFSKIGLFHPVKEHRHARIMRRHLLLLDFLVRAVRNHSAWTRRP